MAEKQTAAKATVKPAAKAAKTAAAPKAAPKKTAPEKAAKLTILGANTVPIVFSTDQMWAANQVWTDAVEANDLGPLFNDNEEMRLTYVSLSAQVAAEMLAAPGGEPAYLEARFVVYDAPEGQSRFTVALSVADGNYNLLTPWYLCDSSWPIPLMVDIEIPYKEAKRWMNAWGNAPEISQPMFETPYGTLLGYNFSISDLSNALAQAQPYDNKFVRMCFGLHSDTGIFGLILRITTASGDPGPEVPCFDLAMAVPPGHR